MKHLLLSILILFISCTSSDSNDNVSDDYKLITVNSEGEIFDIGNKIIKDFKVKELPLMTTFIKALLNNTKFKIDKKLFA